jgi:hypothetical protein
MPEEATAPPADAPDGAAPSPTDSEGQQPEETPDPNSWIRQTATGLFYSRPLDTAAKSKEWDEANTELRRGRKNGTEETRQEPKEDTEPPDPASEPKPPEESDERVFERRVQAEVDRREALRRQRAETQYERDLRKNDPAAYARYKEQQEQQNVQAGAVGNAIAALSRQFDDATVTPLMQALKDEATRNKVLEGAGHGLPGRKEIVTRAIDTLKKSAYDEGFAKGKAEAEKSLRRSSSSLRKELLAELRAEEDEPELAPGNGRSNGIADFDPNEWMRASLGRRTRAASRE